MTPEQRQAANEKAKQIRAELGPRLGHAKPGAGAKRYAVRDPRSPLATGTARSAIRGGHQE